MIFSMLSFSLVAETTGEIKVSAKAMAKGDFIKFIQGSFYGMQAKESNINKYNVSGHLLQVITTSIYNINHSYAGIIRFRY